MLNKEIIQLTLITASTFLFALGGTHITDKIKGKKWLRRYLLPLIIGVLTGNWLIGFLYIIAFSLGYGESKPYWYKFLVGVALIVPSFLLGLTPWQAITPVVFITLFALSNWKCTAKHFPWIICEAVFGLCIGITLVILL